MQEQVYLTREEFTAALRDYCKGKGMAVDDYSEEPIVYSQGEG